MPMSDPYMPAGMGNQENSDDEDSQMLKEAMEANVDYDYFVFAAGGGESDGALVK